MKVILLADVPNIGKKNEIKEVSDGYAKNFLIKRKLAAVHSEGTLKTLEKNLENLFLDEEAKINENKLLKLELEREKYYFTLKANNGLTFHKISSKNIISEINEKHNFKVINKYMFKKFVDLSIGEFKVKLYLYKDVVAEVEIIISEE